MSIVSYIKFSRSEDEDEDEIYLIDLSTSGVEFLTTKNVPVPIFLRKFLILYPNPQLPSAKKKDWDYKFLTQVEK